MWGDWGEVMGDARSWREGPEERDEEEWLEETVEAREMEVVGEWELDRCLAWFMGSGCEYEGAGFCTLER